MLNARELVTQAVENELAAEAQARRAKVAISGMVVDISTGQRDRLTTSQNEGQLVTTREVLRRPFVTFDLEGVRVIASLSDEEDGATALRIGSVGALLCWFGHFDRDGSGKRLMVLEFCKMP